MVHGIAVGDIERDRPTPLRACRPVVAERHRVEIHHLDILRDAPLGGQVHLDVIDEYPEKEIVGVDRADHPAGNLLHRVGEEHIVVRLHQRIDFRGIDLRLPGPALGAVHAPLRFLVDGRALHDLHRRLLHGDNRGLGNAVGTRSPHRELRGLGDGRTGQQKHCPCREKTVHTQYNCEIEPVYCTGLYHGLVIVSVAPPVREKISKVNV